MTNWTWPVWLRTGMLLVLLCASGLLFIALCEQFRKADREPIDENFQRLSVNMTEAEVAAIMGPPAEDFDPAILPSPAMHPNGQEHYKQWLAATARIKKWHGKGGYIYGAHFDKQGRLTNTFLLDKNDAHEF